MAELVTVCKVEDVGPGEVRAFHVNGRDIAVANVDEELYAFDDECTHKSCSLAEGDLEGASIVCVCHGSAFDVRSGDVLNPPATVSVETHDVTIEGDEVKVPR